jgi:ribosomal protein L11 methyltransferase
MVVSQCENLNFEGKRVLDVGTGTGVLGILASKLGARQVVGVDIDPWSYENASENAAMNAVTNFEVIQGTIENAPGGCYDILLANINRNIIITDRDAYISRLCPRGCIVLSGFLSADAERVRLHFESAGLRLLSATGDSGWVSLSFQAS